MINSKETGFAAAINLLGRLLLATFFIWAAVSKFLNYEEAANYMLQESLPSGLLPLTILLELVLGLALLIGWRTQLAAFVLAVFTVLTTLVFYSDFSHVMGMASFSKNMALAGGLFTLASQYPGAWSLDRLRLDAEALASS